MSIWLKQLEAEGISQTPISGLLFLFVAANDRLAADDRLLPEYIKPKFARVSLGLAKALAN